MERLNLTLEIQTQTGNIGAKRVNVRSSLMVANLIAAVKDKFNLDGNFELRVAERGASRPLALESALDQAGVAEGGALVCARVAEATGTRDAIQRGEREAFSKTFKRVWLVENRTLTEYDLAWQPAIIGRKDHRNPTNNRLLAADLEDIEELPTVSRHHACLTEKGGQFFIEDIQGRNPVYLDGERLRPGAQYPLSAGDIIQAGRVWLTFNVIG
jgi:hypothetical protein